MIRTSDAITIPAPAATKTAEAAPPAALETVAALFTALNGEGIRYCHWKSNLRLARGLCGATDLDVLVDPADAERFRAHLDRLAVRRVLAPPGKRYPSIEDYLGYDAPSGQIFHLHVHYRLVLGEQFVKNYSLPLESRFLDGARPRLGVMTPPAELELLVLCLRALLKYRDRDGVKDVFGIRSPGIPAHIVDELRWLAAQTTPERVRAVAAESLGAATANVVGDFLRLVRRAPRDGRELLRLRGAVRLALRPYRRSGRLLALGRYLAESARRRNRLRFGPRRKMTLPGGVSVALLGADGAGKTTVAADLTSWLGRMLEVRGYYQGSKQPSWVSEQLYTSFRVFRRGHRSIAARLGADSPVARLLAGARQLLLNAHYLSVGVDRYRRHRAGRRAASAGAVVLYDRFPLIAPLDGPVIRQSAGATRLMAGLEESLYRRFQPPDLFLVLAVDPDISVQRKPDHSREAIEEKARLLQRLVLDPGLGPVAARNVVIDAGQPLACVLADARQAIWAGLSASAAPSSPTS
jgi:thymidylate kinase